MNLRSFTPPPPTRPGRVPEVGVAAPPSFGVLRQSRPAVVCFLRHVGCPFAEAVFRQARDLAADDADVDWIAVSHADRAATDDWAEQLGGAGNVRIVIDEPRALYAAWGLGRTSLAHFAGRRSLGAVIRLALRGIRNRRAHGTRWQRSGAFAVDRDRVVRWRQLPAHAGDLPDLAVARAALGYSSPGSSSSAAELMQ